MELQNQANIEYRAKINKLRFVLYILVAAISLAVGFTLSLSGEAFLRFVGKKLGIDIVHTPRVGFISCFVLRTIELNNPSFVIKDFDFAIGCQKAHIEPDFQKILEGEITLKCSFKNATFLSIEEKLKINDGLLAFLDRSVLLLFEKLINILCDSIETTFVMHEDEVDFLYFNATSRDIKLRASASASRKQEFNIDAKFFFSPDMVKTFPEPLKEMLTEEAGGWFSYHLGLQTDQASKPYLKLESDRLKIIFEKMEVK